MDAITLDAFASACSELLADALQLKSNDCSRGSEILTRDEAAALARVDVRTIDEAIRQKQLAVVKIGRAVRISHQSLVAWIAIRSIQTRILELHVLRSQARLAEAIAVARGDCKCQPNAVVGDKSLSFLSFIDLHLQIAAMLTKQPGQLVQTPRAEFGLSEEIGRIRAQIGDKLKSIPGDLRLEVIVENDMNDNRRNLLAELSDSVFTAMFQNAGGSVARKGNAPDMIKQITRHFGVPYSRAMLYADGFKQRCEQLKLRPRVGRVPKSSNT